MKNLLLAVGLFTLIMWTSCGDGNILEQTDPTIQAAEDSATIVNYIEDIGLTGQDSLLESGVRFVILNEGTGTVIDESDIVSFNYTGKTLQDTIFDSSIKEVGDSVRMAIEANITPGDTTAIEQELRITFDEDRSYTPIQYTYSASGWTLSSSGLVAGFVDGVSAALNGLRIGGSALIVLPSSQAYSFRGSGLLIPPNTVIAFEIYPAEVIKQPPLED